MAEVEEKEVALAERVSNNESLLASNVKISQPLNCQMITDFPTNLLSFPFLVCASINIFMM